MKSEQQTQQQPEQLLAPQDFQKGSHGGTGVDPSNEGLAPDFSHKFDNLQELVSDPTWRDVIIDVVHGGKIDAWDLDIVEITNKYINQVKEMKVQNLHVPANVILAASILLRFKSEALDLMEEPEEIPVLEGFDELQNQGLEVSPLQLRFRIPPKRTITLTDLITSLNEAMDIEYKREHRVKLKVNPILEIRLPDYDIDKEMVTVINTVEKLADKEGWLTFTDLLSEMEKSTAMEKVQTLLPILHLCQEHKLHIIQEEVFGEILIHIGESNEEIDTYDSEDGAEPLAPKLTNTLESNESDSQQPTVKSKTKSKSKNNETKQKVEAGVGNGRSRKTN